MQGNSNIKFIVAKQAKEIYKHKTTKRTNAAIWFNKICAGVSELYRVYLLYRAFI